MSFVLDQIRRIDAQLDRLQLANNNLPSAAIPSPQALQQQQQQQQQQDAPSPPTLSPRLLALQASIRALTPSTSDHRALLRPTQIQVLLSALSERADLTTAAAGDDDNGRRRESLEPFETELEWLLVSKATTQVYGHVLQRILAQTVGLAEDVYYWEAVLGSRRWSAVYGVQVAPGKLWAWGCGVWADVQARGGRRDEERGDVAERWRRFYGLVWQVVGERSVAEVRRRVLSPVTRVRGEVRAKQKVLKAVRLRNANALGVLLGEGLANESAHGEGSGTGDVQRRWKASVARNVALMEAVLAKVDDLETPVEKFDAAVAELTEDDPLYALEGHEQAHDGVSLPPRAVAERLTRVLALALPQYGDSTTAVVREHGRPSRLVRYWLPVTIGILSSSTILRILVNRQAEIVQWIRDLGTTTIDFWRNWVVEPTRKVIKTIRHDEGSEVSIMSKRSLEGDRDSLERMVVDFAIDNPSHTDATVSGSSGTRLTDAEIATIRTKVREGDLTPVLRAYEKDLASPFMGTVRGNLIRALLIQVQKTKVDVEVAMGGIDALLKSQELVFGFVGLTPGILVTYAALRSLRTSLSDSRGGASRKRQGTMLRQLRNVDRILSAATPTEYGELYYKDQGLLVCEVHGLREAAATVMPAEIYREFAEDAEELCDVRVGAERQRMAAARVRWAYGRWFS